MIHLGGIELSHEDPAILQRAWEHLDPQLWELPLPPGWDGRLAPFLPPRPRLGILSWPVHASRWAWGRYLADLPTVDALLALVTTVEGGPLTLRLDDGQEFVETAMYLLPPRPLYQSGVGDYYLLDLVDIRYRWWAISTTELASGTTWADTFTAISAIIGVTIEVDAVAEAYTVVPPRILESGPLPVILDILAAAAGQRIVRTLSGRVISLTPESGQAIQNTNLLLTDRPAGGSLTPPPPLIPQALAVTFPALSDGLPVIDGHSETVTLESLSLPVYAGIGPGSHTALVRTTALYSSDVATEITALAIQISRDWYNWRSRWVAVALNGFRSWEMDAFGDVDYEQTERLLTRVMPAPCAEASAASALGFYDRDTLVVPDCCEPCYEGVEYAGNVLPWVEGGEFTGLDLTGLTGTLRVVDGVLTVVED